MTEYTFTIEGRPVPKERPRMSRGGRVYTPKRTTDAERRIRNEYQGPMIEGPVRLAVVFFDDHTAIEVAPHTHTSTLRGDIDNYVKLLMDGLNGAAWADDRQVVEITARKC